jgi:hypothetical protein
MLKVAKKKQLEIARAHTPHTSMIISVTILTYVEGEHAQYVACLDVVKSYGQ